MRFRYFYLLFYAILFIRCQDSSLPIHVVKNGIKLTIPGYFKEDELAEDAFVEYANRYRNFYLICMELPGQYSKDSLRIIASERILKGLEKSSIDSSRDFHGHLRMKIEGYFPEEPEKIHYYQKIIVSSNKNFLLSIWLRGDERARKYSEDVDSILESFQIAQ